MNAPVKAQQGAKTPKNQAKTSFAALWKPALKQAFVKLDPRQLLRSPVMLVVEITAVLTTVLCFVPNPAVSTGLAVQIALWLWFTVLFANFAEALAEGRGKARADSLKAGSQGLTARRKTAGEQYQVVAASQLRRGDIVRVEAGELIPGDGEVIEGIAAVNEAAITGESAPVIRESGGDRSAVTGNTRVVSDWLLVKITANPGESTLDRMIALVEGAKRQKTPNEVALDILLIGLTLIFLLVVATLQPFARYAGGDLPLVYLAALLVTLIPTTIGGLLSAIGIAGMDRLVRLNVIAKSGRAVEAAGDVHVLLLDKTGTITFGNRRCSAVIKAPGINGKELGDAALLASLADDTPEGKSIVEYLRPLTTLREPARSEVKAIAFSAETRLSGVDWNGHSYRKGAVDAVLLYLGLSREEMPAPLAREVEKIAQSGGTPLLVAGDGQLLGAIHLKDVVKPGIRERFAELRSLGIRTVMVTGDNPLTAAAIAAEAGVDDLIAEATPEKKLQRIRAEQAEGKMVAMCGDGANDAPALAQADVGLAMNDGTQAAREAANLVDLDSDPTKLLDVVQVGKELLVTRGALTTFSVANDVAKYFAILPALFAGIYPQLGALNLMQLHSPQSAILSAIVFNALIIIALIPLALRGVRVKALDAASLLRRNLLIYGLGGILAPFVGIKVIDALLVAVGLVQ
ncbi:potassium-transporting ATPase ATP-binding subunit [Aquipseudomonas alcaligenes]|uniref:Potassium-transporting ATPase ATP-binding subunit n=2 Tax=Aquipseudomonas alcaligenes TaxID=43263 RepID=A0AA37CDK1_AQUAC|nr:potassium-transporting ATPase subunit KdpB [Pseudomonas alcaligenes]BCR24709.1 potassium-transporting ATPase ATP-binding subunit [Pseudomonas alcaligenes]GIZ66176.1 potassium-transporting ATPase ATP-binding subunit [Pseudomonas alcaligenes]GIZ70231.1 potassium-transporting ATPase ATP-binding subunit [Pseudomonas alcaligenes]GIZ74584.1 potassium-transporting ATPase ATP-binding subunit [Pseudomonas alcaligenes]GIZ79190.1 potassium-transporting ATPase ATP-binding subunit [Pseudomonas alcaligen